MTICGSSSVRRWRRFASAPVARLVILELTDDPLLSLMFAERMFATIAGLAAKADLVWGLELLIGRLTEATMIESGAWARRDPKLAVDHIQARIVKASKTEFPTLTFASHTFGAKCCWARLRLIRGRIETYRAPSPPPETVGSSGVGGNPARGAKGRPQRYGRRRRRP